MSDSKWIYVYEFPDVAPRHRSWWERHRPSMPRIDWPYAIVMVIACAMQLAWVAFLLSLVFAIARWDGN